MTDFILNALWPVSVTILILLCTRRFVLNKLGSQVSYQLWLLVPLSILFSVLPKPEALTITLDPQRYLVTDIASVGEVIPAPGNLLEFIWLVGAAILLLGFVVAQLKHSKELHRTISPVDLSSNGGQSLLKEYNHHALPMYQSSQTLSPILTGFIKTKLVLPKGFEKQYSAIQQQLILSHENYHYGRSDIYWNYFSMLLLVVFWFHPLAWLAYLRYRQDQELSCDHAILVNQSTENRQQYAHALLNTLEKQRVGVAYLSFGKFGDSKQMLERIKQLKQAKRSHKLIAPSLLIIGAVALASSIHAEDLSLSEEKSDDEKAREELKNLKPIVRINPSYPEEAKAENIEGYVVLSFNVLPNGTVDGIRVVDSEPEEVFDIAAKQAVAKWRYVPYKHIENPNVTMQLDFNLDDT